MKSKEQTKRTFSDELIRKCQLIILERSGKKISKDKAELYLDKFARLMKVIIKIDAQRRKNDYGKN